MNGGGKKRFVVLDGMRGLAALAIITDHIDSPLLSAALSGRALAVDFFFVLSGFVLSHVYADRLASGMSWQAFMRARVIRLYPLYLAGLVAGAMVLAIEVWKGWRLASWSSMASASGLGLLMLPTPLAWSPSPYNIFPFDGPAWSLFFEMLANLAFGIFFLRLSNRVLLAIVAVGAASLALTVAHFGGIASAYNWQNFVVGFPRVTFGFFAGVLVHRFCLKRPAPAVPAWAAFAALLAVLMFPAHGLWRAWFDLAAALVVFPLLVAVSAGAEPRGWLARAASWLGLLSYGIYILHVPVRDWINLSLAVLVPAVHLPGVAEAALVAGAAIAVAAALHVVYDEPVRRRLLRRRRGARETASGVD
jgi:peptidoglycan/LPS O-acetylase OafA/YrhL